MPLLEKPSQKVGKSFENNHCCLDFEFTLYSILFCAMYFIKYLACGWWHLTLYHPLFWILLIRRGGGSSGPTAIFWLFGNILCPLVSMLNHIKLKSFCEGYIVVPYFIIFGFNIFFNIQIFGVCKRYLFIKLHLL